MPLTPATCPKCGGILDVDSELEAANCRYCGTPFIVEKAISVFNTTHNTTYVTNSTSTTNISGSEVHIHQDGDDAQTLFDNLKALLSLEKYDAVTNTLEKLNDKFPADVRTYEAEVLYDWRDPEYDINNGTIRFKFRSLLELYSFNKETGLQYIERYKGETNAYLSKVSGKNFTGDLMFYKLALASLYKRLRSQDKTASKLKDDENVPYYDLNPFRTVIDGICNIFEKGQLCDTPIPNELHGYDDEFCLYAIEKTNNYKRAYKSDDILTDEFFGKVLRGLKKLMSPSGKAAQKEKEHVAAEQKKQREKEALKAKITKLWDEYTRLLKNGKIKEAYELMQKDNSYIYKNEELKNFKKTLFGFKYLGSATTKSTAELLEELNLN